MCGALDERTFGRLFGRRVCDVVARDVAVASLLSKGLRPLCDGSRCVWFSHRRWRAWIQWKRWWCTLGIRTVPPKSEETFRQYHGSRCFDGETLRAARIARSYEEVCLHWNRYPARGNGVCGEGMLVLDDHPSIARRVPRSGRHNESCTLADCCRAARGECLGMCSW